MADPFVAEIRIFPFYFAPRGWAFCAGQLLPISQNTALFSLLGTMYGGDGKSTFALPDLQAQTAMHSGDGPGLSQRFQGETGGTPNVTLLTSEIPSHIHYLDCRATVGNTTTAADGVPALGAWASGNQSGVVQAYSTSNPNTQMALDTLSPAGGSLPHNNMMPYLTLSFCIALQGVFPPRS